jgi:hypothetical protein
MLVVSALPADRTALWERDPRHPNGEVFVVGSQPQEVGETERVRELLRNGTLKKFVPELPKVPPVAAAQVAPVAARRVTKA